MRTTEEILAYMIKVQEEDVLGVMREDCILALPFETAKQFLGDGVTEDDFNQLNLYEASKGLEFVKSYLRFAWGKANNCRGISAARSVQHLCARLWLAGYGKLSEEHFSGDYEWYGKPQLVIASELCGFDWRAHDNGRWVNTENGPSLSKANIDIAAAKAAQIAAEAKVED